MGAQTTLQLCYENYENLHDGGYYANCSSTSSLGESNDMTKGERFMKYCANLVDINSREDNKLNNLNYLKYLRDNWNIFKYCYRKFFIKEILKYRQYLKIVYMLQSSLIT